MTTKFTPRNGCQLNFAALNRDGKLIGIFDSESEAYYFTKNRGHAEGGSIVKLAVDYSTAPELFEALEGLLTQSASLDQSATHDGLENCKAIAMARAALQKARGE